SRDSTSPVWPISNPRTPRTTTPSQPYDASRSVTRVFSDRGPVRVGPFGCERLGAARSHLRALHAADRDTGRTPTSLSRLDRGRRRTPGARAHVRASSRGRPGHVVPVSRGAHALHVDEKHLYPAR